MGDFLREAEKRHGLQEELQRSEQAMKDAQAEYVWLERIRERRTAGQALKLLEANFASSQEVVAASILIEENLRKERAGAILQVQDLLHKAQAHTYNHDGITAWMTDNRVLAASLKGKVDVAEKRHTVELDTYIHFRDGQAEMQESCTEMRANESALRTRIDSEIQRRVDLQAELSEAHTQLEAWRRAQDEAAALTVRANEVLRRSPPGSPARQKSPEREAPSGYASQPAPEEPAAADPPPEDAPQSADAPESSDPPPSADVPQSSDPPAAE
jgi:hypothetical protein